MENVNLPGKSTADLEVGAHWIFLTFRGRLALFCTRLKFCSKSKNQDLNHNYSKSKYRSKSETKV